MRSPSNTIAGICASIAHVSGSLWAYDDESAALEAKASEIEGRLAEPAGAKVKPGDADLGVGPHISELDAFTPLDIETLRKLAAAPAHIGRAVAKKRAAEIVSAHDYMDDERERLGVKDLRRQSDRLQGRVTKLWPAVRDLFDKLADAPAGTMDEARLKWRTVSAALRMGDDPVDWQRNGAGVDETDAAVLLSIAADFARLTASAAFTPPALLPVETFSIRAAG
jgi:hypothetical protein